VQRIGGILGNCRSKVSVRARAPLSADAASLRDALPPLSMQPRRRASFRRDWFSTVWAETHGPDLAGEMIHGHGTIRSSAALADAKLTGSALMRIRGMRTRFLDSRRTPPERSAAVRAAGDRITLPGAPEYRRRSHIAVAAPTVQDLVGLRFRDLHVRACSLLIS
jgi:hypothetical protein